MRPQGRDYDCAIVAAVNAIAALGGGRIDEVELARRARTSIDGTTSRDLAEALQSFGFDATNVFVPSAVAADIMMSAGAAIAVTDTQISGLEPWPQTRVEDVRAEAQLVQLCPPAEAVTPRPPPDRPTHAVCVVPGPDRLWVVDSAPWGGGYGHVSADTVEDALAVRDRIVRTTAFVAGAKASLEVFAKRLGVRIDTSAMTWRELAHALSAALVTTNAAAFAVVLASPERPETWLAQPIGSDVGADATHLRTIGVVTLILIQKPAALASAA